MIVVVHAVVAAVIVMDVSFVLVYLVRLRISSKQNCISLQAFNCMHVGESIFIALFIAREETIFTS